MASRLKKGDQVIVRTGKDAGKKGEIIRVDRSAERVYVSGVNLVTKHTKPSAANPQGGITKKEAPIHMSNVALADPKTGKPTKVGFKFLTDGTKVRFARKSGEVIDG